MKIFLAILWALSLVVLLLLLCEPEKATYSNLQAWSGTVTRVFDGDTITVKKGRKGVRVRLYGIDAPETKQEFGDNAKKFTADQVMGKLVDIKPIDFDRYKRIVGLVSDGKMILNKRLVRQGYAWVYPEYCKRSFCSDWSELEAEAKVAKKGLWRNPNAIPPWQYRHPEKTKAPKRP